MFSRLRKLNMMVLIDDHAKNRTERQCWSCHQEVPHGTIHGISTIKNNIAPIPTDPEKSVIPEWLEKEMENKKK